MGLAELRWTDAWKALGALEPPGLLGDLISRYSETHRAYHTLQHIAECFEALEPASHLADRLGEVQIALWFHDAVYDPRTSDNEQRSAELAAVSLVRAGAEEETSSRVRALILATRHDTVPTESDAKLIVDIDVAILGSERERFLEYETQIREEYSWVPEEAFRLRRAELLSVFIQRDFVYGTQWFRQRLEQRARANIADAVHRLRSSD